MVKLSQDVIEQAYQCTNPVKDRQLDLRGYKIPAIENLGATLDQFDCIDFSDNEIRKVDNFPLLKRIKCLLLSSNHISRIGENLERSLPNLLSLVLMNNRIQELADLDPLETVKTLESISLLYNAVTKKKYYRHYLIFKLPQLKRIDFQKVKLKEREAAGKIFSGKSGEQLLADIAERSKSKQAITATATATPATTANVISAAEVAEQHLKNNASIKAVIEGAKTLEEVEALKRQLQNRSFNPDGQEEEEMDM